MDAHQKKWRELHYDEWRRRNAEYQKKWRSRHIDEAREKDKQYRRRIRHPDGGETKVVVDAEANRKAARKARYELRKAYGICVQCGKDDALPGKVLCWRCRLWQHDRRVPVKE